MDTSDAAIKRGFAHAADLAIARARADAHGGAHPSGESAMAALAALALGDAAPAAAVLNAWVEQTAAEATPRRRDTLLTLLLAARHLAWTADAALARRVWPVVQEASRRVAATVTPEGGLTYEVRTAGAGPNTADPASDGGIAAAGASDDAGFRAALGGVLRELVPLAEVCGDRAAGAALTTEARSLLGEARGSPADSASLGYLIAAAAGAFDPDPPSSIGSPGLPPPGSRMSLSDAAYAGWLTWAALSAGTTEAAGEWRSLLTSLEQVSAPASNDSDERPDAAGDAAALAIAAGIFGLIGLSPDATKNRLRLRPHVPNDWDIVAVREIAMGNGRFDFTVSRRDGRRTYTIEQTVGAIPATVILEMLVPGPLVRSITVDGRQAGLDIRPFGPGFLIPVQLVADDVRIVEIDGEGY